MGGRGGAGDGVGGVGVGDVATGEGPQPTETDYFRLDSPEGRQLLFVALFGAVMAPPKLRRETAVVPEYLVSVAGGGTLTAELVSNRTLGVDGYLGGAEAITIRGFLELMARLPPSLHPPTPTHLNVGDDVFSLSILAAHMHPHLRCAARACGWWLAFACGGDAGAGELWPRDGGGCDRR